MSGDNEELKTIFSCKRSGLPFPSSASSNNPPVLICLAGFPDTASVWDPLVNRPELQTTHHIIALGLPGYHLDALPADHKWGYTIDEIQEALHKVVLYCQRHGAKTAHLLAHDWGASYGYVYIQEHKKDSIVKKFASLDIGIFKPPEMPKSGLLKMFSYMFWFSLCFVANNLFGSSLAGLLMKAYPWKTIGPLNNQEQSLSFLQTPMKKPFMMYPYYQYFRNTQRITTSFSRTKHLPVCFMYGTQKNIFYHSEEYVNKLEAAEGCSSKAFDGGHWFFAEERHAPSVAKTLKKFYLEGS